MSRMNRQLRLVCTLSRQIIPSILPKLLGDPNRVNAGRAMNAMLQMKKIDIAALERAFAGDFA